MNVVETSALRKSYSGTEILHGIELCVPCGSLYGFLGPNGAGKSTTIRILLGLLRPSDGEARVFGQDAWTDGPSLRARVGYLPGDVRFYGGLTGKATLDFLAHARGVDVRAEIVRLADRFGLDLSKRVRSYSRGMKQKLGLIQAMMHKPDLLILDEPTVSLDPLNSEALYAELREHSQAGRTILFSSHILSEVEALCDWVAILRDGLIIEQDRIDALRTRAVRRVEIKLKHAEACGAFPQGLRVIRHRDGRVIGGWTGPITNLLHWLNNAPVEDVIITPPDLEDLFLAYYSNSEGRGGL